MKDLSVIDPMCFLLSNGVRIEGEVQNRIIVAMQEYGYALVNQQRFLMQKHINIRNVPKPKI